MADTPNTTEGAGTVSDLADLKVLTGADAAAPAAVAADDPGEAAPPPPPRGGPAARQRGEQVDAQGRAYATGRRKDAVARVWLKPGNGKITVNGRDQETYFARPTLRLVIAQPFQVADR